MLQDLHHAGREAALREVGRPLHVEEDLLALHVGFDLAHHVAALGAPLLQKTLALALAGLLAAEAWTLRAESSGAPALSASARLYLPDAAARPSRLGALAAQAPTIALALAATNSTRQL
jgi:hypothetical protein